MPGKMEPLGCGMGGIVDDPDALRKIEMGNGVQQGRELRQFQIMIPNNQSGGNGKRGQKLRKRGLQLWSDAGKSMEKIPGNDELGGLIFLTERTKPGYVAGAITLWQRQSPRAESCGFTQMNIRNNEGSAFR